MHKTKRFFSKFIAVFLVGVIALSAGCGGKQEEAGQGEVINKVEYSGTHNYTAKQTADFLVKDGKTEYKLVVPKAQTDKLKMAKEEFLYFFEQATGISMSIIYDTDDADNSLTHDKDNKYVSIGNTTLALTANVSTEGYDLGNDGVRIETKDKTIFLLGGSDTGVIYAVYDFMKIEFGYEQYAADCFVIDKGVTDVTLKNYDVTDIPDIAIRVYSSRVIQQRHNTGYDGKMNKYRMRMPAGISEYYFPIHKGDNATGNSATFHNCTYYAPVEEFGSTHPDWFGDQSMKQLCYTAHGNEAELELLLEQCAKKITDSLTKYDPVQYPQFNAVTLSMSDGESTCNCAKCTELANKYGAESGAVIIFMNRLNKLVHEWMDKPENAAYKREELQIIFFAYNSYTTAPAVYNEQAGKWEPKYPEVALDKGVGVFFAQIANIDYQQSLYSSMNKPGFDNAAAWFDLSEKVFLWTYSTNFHDYYIFYDSFSFYNNDAYKFYAAKGAVYWYNQQQYNHEYASPTFHDLKIYIDSKLMWDSTIPMEQLIDGYFKAMFKEAAGVMKQLFTEMRIHSAQICQDYGFYTLKSIYNNVLLPQYYPFAVVERWLNLCEKAMETVSKYKTSNPGLYDTLMNHIYAESIAPLYIILKLHVDQLSTLQYNYIKDLFRTAVYTTNISATGEYSDTALFDMANA